MPAITVDDTLVLPRIARPTRPLQGPTNHRVVTAHRQSEGAGFVIRRPFRRDVDGRGRPLPAPRPPRAPNDAPGEAKGAPWHPHRGFETVSYILDGVRSPITTPTAVGV